jgi:hypothetical protein
MTQNQGAVCTTRSQNPAKGLEVQVHHLISLGGWNDVVSIFRPFRIFAWLSETPINVALGPPAPRIVQNEYCSTYDPAMVLFPNHVPVQVPF